MTAHTFVTAMFMVPNEGLAEFFTALDHLGNAGTAHDFYTEQTAADPAKDAECDPCRQAAWRDENCALCEMPLIGHLYIGSDTPSCAFLP